MVCPKERATILKMKNRVHAPDTAVRTPLGFERILGIILS